MPRGFNDTRDLVTTTDGIPFIRMYDDIQVALADYNATQGFLQSGLTMTTTEEKIKEGLAQTQMHFQRATEYGRPDRQRIDQVERERYLPIEDFSLGLGFTRKYLALASAAKVAQQVDEATRADQELVIAMILQQMLRIENLGDAGQFRAFWNADGDTPPTYGSYTFASSHTHYLFAAAWSTTVTDAIQLKLVEHGLTGSMELWIQPGGADETAIRALTTFIPAPPLLAQLWTNTNPVAASNRVIATVDPTQFIGVVGNLKIRTFSRMPVGYAFAYDAVPAGLGKPLAWREYPVASFRGLQLFNENPDSSFPLVNSFFARSFGLAALNRSNGVCFKIDAGSYTTPTIMTI